MNISESRCGLVGVALLSKIVKKTIGSENDKSTTPMLLHGTKIPSKAPTKTFHEIVHSSLPLHDIKYLTKTSTNQRP